MEEQGIAWRSSADKPYVRLRPAEHTRVCWSAAIGRARHDGLPHGEGAARWALEDLAGGEECLCGKRPTKRAR